MMKIPAQDSQRRDLKPASRRERRAKQMVEQAKKRRKVIPSLWRQWRWGIAVVVIVLIGLGIAVLMRSQPSDIAGIITYSKLSRDHRKGSLIYAQVPPIGGAHSAAWQNCGIYSQPIPNEQGVHSLEHGAVWITYRPSLSKQSVEQLWNLVRGQDHALLSPYPGLPSPVVISTWGVQLKVNSANDPRLAQFLSKYEQGSQTPEPGAPCSGSMGTPEVR